MRLISPIRIGVPGNFFRMVISQWQCPPGITRDQSLQVSCTCSPREQGEKTCITIRYDRYSPHCWYVSLHGDWASGRCSSAWERTDLTASTEVCKRLVALYGDQSTLNERVNG